MGKPLFSIIFPTYGVEDYIRDAIEDIIYQSNRDWELIIVDDASPDHSGAIADEYAKEESRIRVVHLHENGGVSNARNVGMDQAQGEYLLFLDPDDRFDTDLLDLLRYEIERNHPQLIVYGLTEDFYGADGTIRASIPHYLGDCFCENKEQLRRQLMPLEAETLYGYPWNKAYQADFLRSTGARFPKIRLVEDILFNIEVFGKADTLSVLSCRPAHYRNILHGERKSRLTGAEKSDYFSLQKVRVEALIRQQRSFSGEVKLSPEAKKVLAGEYFRSFSSWISRQLRAGVSEKEIGKNARQEMQGEIYRLLKDDFVPAGRAARFLIAPIPEGRIFRAIRRAALVNRIRQLFPGLYARLKQQR